VKVVEDQEIYNFPIIHLVHLCVKIVRKPRSNSATLHCEGTRTRLDSVTRDVARGRQSPTYPAVPQAEAGLGPPDRALWTFPVSHRLSPPLPGRHVPRAPWPGRADHAARPTVSQPYWAARQRCLALIPRPWDVSTCAHHLSISPRVYKAVAALVARDRAATVRHGHLGEHGASANSTFIQSREALP
jgi:hypothetical protein